MASLVRRSSSQIVRVRERAVARVGHVHTHVRTRGYT